MVIKKLSSFPKFSAHLGWCQFWEKTLWHQLSGGPMAGDLRISAAEPMFQGQAVEPRVLVGNPARVPSTVTAPKLPPSSAHSLLLLLTLPASCFVLPKYHDFLVEFRAADKWADSCGFRSFRTCCLGLRCCLSIKELWNKVGGCPDLASEPRDLGTSD